MSTDHHECPNCRSAICCCELWAMKRSARSAPLAPNSFYTSMPKKVRQRIVYPAHPARRHSQQDRV